MTRQRIHCLGVLVVDALSGPLESYPVRRQKTQVITRNVCFMPGGGAANTGSALGRMGLAVSVFSKLGDDANGAFMLRELKKVGVNTDGICVAPEATTPFTFVGIHPDGDRTFIHTPGANLDFTLEDLDKGKVLATDFLLYQDFWVMPRIDGKPGADLLAEAHKRGVVTLLDECWGLGPNRGSFEMMVPHCDYVLPSLDDMQAIYAGLSESQIVDHLFSLGARHVVLKMGARGCLAADGRQRVLVHALPSRVVDTTGAGDCWNAGFLAGLAHGEDLVAAAVLGCSCAAFGVSAVGGSAGVPEYAHVRQRAEEAIKSLRQQAKSG